MTIEAFFEKFDLFAETPNAVSKMRELILQLATTGKLIEQDPYDESADQLFERVRKHFGLLRSKKVLPSSPVETIADSTQLADLPNSWKWVCLGDIADYGSTNKVESSQISPGSWLLDLEDIEKDTSRLIRRKTFGQSPSLSTKTEFGAEDVLYGKLRPYLNKVLVADSPGYCTTEIIPIRTFGLIVPKYLCYVLKSPRFLAYANSKSYGMNLPRLGTEDARRAPFPLPPLSEQKRIVAKVDELLSLCDRLEAQQQERDSQQEQLARAALVRFTKAPTPANVEVLFHSAFKVSPTELRRAILNLAIQGKLVPQRADDEPASRLLERILYETGSFNNKKIKSSSYASSHECNSPFDLPAGWSWAQFPELGKFGRGKSKHRPRNDKVLFEGGTHLLIQTGDVARSNGTIKTYTSKYNNIGLAQSFKWPKGTLCITIAANIADSGILGFEACFPDSVVGFVPSPILPNAKYFEYFLRTAKENLLKFAPSTAQKNINLEILSAVLIPLPPLAEQQRIVDKVDSLMALVDELEIQLTQSREQSKNLMEALIMAITNLQQGGTDELAATQP